MFKISSLKSGVYNSKITDTYIHDVEERAYVSRKILKVRWKPEGFDEHSKYFVTGSYDNPMNNGLDLWSFSQTQEAELSGNAEFTPVLQSSLKTESNVTDICFTEDKEHFAYCTDSGGIGIVKVKVSRNSKELEARNKRSSSEWFGPQGVTCSSMDVYESTLAVSSSDGRICLMPTDASKMAGTIVGPVPIHSLKFISKDELVTGSLIGSVSMWDLRSDSTTPSQSFPLCRSQRIGVTCVTLFPTEKHMIVCGGRNGLISVFDARNLPIPVRVFSTTDSSIADLRFHPTRYSVLFSLSSRGTIWQWSNFFQLFDPLRKQDASSLDTPVDQSLLLEYKTVPPEVKCLLSNSRFYTNSLDLNKDRLLCGTDNECIIAIKSLNLK